MLSMAKAPVTRAKTLDLATVQANLAKTTQAVDVAQKQVNDISSQVTKLTTQVSQLDKQIKNDQAKVAEIEDTLANLPEKQAEAKQKLADLKADSALKDETLKITQNELQEKEATLATAKEQLAIVTDAQADAQFIADQADQDVISLGADLQEAQAYQYRMEHADELLSVAQAQLTMAEQAVTDAENELVSVTSNQAQAQQKLSQAKEKQKQAQKNFDLLMSDSHAKQSNVNGADVITLSHQTVVLPSNQKSNSDKVVLPETGVKKDAPAFGVLGLLLVSLGMGGFAKSKNRRRRA
jgi:LPXTG-motif cell wall-anchored protein